MFKLFFWNRAHLKLKYWSITFLNRLDIYIIHLTNKRFFFEVCPPSIFFLGTPLTTTTSKPGDRFETDRDHRRPLEVLSPCALLVITLEIRLFFSGSMIRRSLVTFETATNFNAPLIKFIYMHE